MPIGDPVEVFRLNDDNELEPYWKGHLLKSNKTRSKATFEAGGEQDSACVTFTVRWCPLISEIEFDMSSFRVVWRGKTFDVIGYDDFMYQHRKVDISCRSLGGPYG